MNRPLWDGPSEPLLICGARPGSGAAIVSLSGARIGPGCARSACAARRSASSGGPGSSGRGGGNLLRCVPSVGRATLQAVDEIGSLAATRSLWRIAIPPAGIGMMEQNPLAHGILGPPDGTVSPDGSRTGRTADARAARSRSAPAPRRAYQMSRRRRAGYPRSRPRSLDQSATASTCRDRPAEAAAYHDGLPAVNGHSNFPHLRSSKIPPPLVYKAMR